MGGITTRSTHSKPINQTQSTRRTYAEVVSGSSRVLRSQGSDKPNDSNPVTAGTAERNQTQKKVQTYYCLSFLQFFILTLLCLI